MSRDLVAAMLAARSIGCVYSVFGVRATEFEVSRDFNQLGCRVVITTRSVAGRAQSLGLIERQRWRDCIIAEYETASSHAFGSSDACVIFTSGSTARPKGVVLTDSSVTNNARGVAEFSCLSPLDRSVVFTQPQFAFAQSQILSHLFAGAPFLPWPSGVGPNDLLWRTLIDVGATGLCANPSAYDLLLRSASKESVVRSVRYVVSAGQPLLSPFANRLRAAFPNGRLASCYGCTENTLRTTYYWLSPRECDEFTILPVGRPIRGTRVDIVGEDGVLAESGQRGTVRISGDSLMRGYLDQLRGPTDAIASFDTEDIGYIDEIGDLHLLGRSSTRMSVGNEKVSPEEVESVIAGTDGVQECAVGPINDEILGEVAAAIVVISSSANADIVTRAVQTRCERLLGRAKRPKYVFIVDGGQIPRTEYGKLSRRQLPEILADLALGRKQS
jgi:long-chain acyl-CoA synthetase